MRIAVDYDNTVSADPEFWTAFARSAIAAGHDCRVVTARDHRYDRTAPLVELEQEFAVIFTDGVAKRWFVEHFVPDFWPVSVWIDDKPESILQNSTTSVEDLAAWRLERGEGPSIPRRACKCA